MGSEDRKICSMCAVCLECAIVDMSVCSLSLLSELGKEMIPVVQMHWDKRLGKLGHVCPPHTLGNSVQTSFTSALTLTGTLAILHDKINGRDVSSIRSKGCAARTSPERVSAEFEMDCVPRPR